MSHPTRLLGQQPHEPADTCHYIHCHIHDVDEYVEKPYHVCFECNHAYRNSRELRRAYRRGLWKATHGAEGLIRRVWRITTVRASRIHHCPHCLHDF